MATHSSILAWEIPWREEPGGLQCMGLQRGKTQLSNHTTRCSTSQIIAAAAAAAKSLQLCPTLCDPIDSSPPGSSIPGILQARILEWVATSFSNACMHAKSLQSCPTPCDPIDSSPPGSSIPGILQARLLEWVAISSSNS